MSLLHSGLTVVDPGEGLGETAHTKKLKFTTTGKSYQVCFKTCWQGQISEHTSFAYNWVVLPKLSIHSLACEDSSHISETGCLRSGCQDLHSCTCIMPFTFNINFMISEQPLLPSKRRKFQGCILYGAKKLTLN